MEKKVGINSNQQGASFLLCFVFALNMQILLKRESAIWFVIFGFFSICVCFTTK